MNLKAYQLNIRQLLKGKWNTNQKEDSYFQALHQSNELAIVKEIALWWRAFQMEQNCPLSSGLLKQRQKYNQAIEAFYSNNNVSPYVEAAANQFLQFLEEWSKEDIVRIMIAFEKAYINVKMGSNETYTFYWNINPYDLLHYALGGAYLAEGTQGILTYKCTISKDIEGFFNVEALTPMS